MDALSLLQLHIIDTMNPALQRGITLELCAECPIMSIAELLLMLQAKPPQPPHHPVLLKALAKELQCEPADIVDFELNLCDTVPGTIGGGPPSFAF